MTNPTKPKAKAKPEARTTGSKPEVAETSPTRGRGPVAETDEPQRTAAGEGPPPDPTATPSEAPDTPVSPGQPTTHKQIAEQREKQLEDGKVAGKVAKAAQALADATPVEQRANQLGARLVDGRVDNMSRRSDADALFGHFAVIDFSDEEYGDDARKAVEAVIGEGNAGVNSGNYGVYVDNGILDEHGYPLTVTVMLRDEHAAQVPNVPYGALRPADQGGRR